MAPQSGMDRGVVALIDALGFKGLWQRWSASDVISKMNRMKEAAYSTQLLRAPGGLGYVAKDRVRLAFLSDSVAVAMALHDVEPDDQIAVVVLAQFLQILQHIALVTNPPLLYRGAVTVGEFLFDDTFIVGPAVDEAANAFERADGPFVWMTESALAAHGPQTLNQPYGAFYDVPMKDGRTVRSVCVFPVFHTQGMADLTRLAARRAQLRGRYEETFGSDHETKRRHSMAFFDAMLANMMENDEQVRGARRNAALDEEYGHAPGLYPMPNATWVERLYDYEGWLRDDGLRSMTN